MMSFWGNQSNMVAIDIEHFYVKIKGKSLDGTPHKYEFGKVAYRDDYKSKLNPLNIQSEDEFIDIINRHTPTSDYDLNFYIHGMWANQSMIWKETVRNISRDIYAKQSRKQVIISYIWDAAIPYSKSVKLARNKGRQTSDLTFEIIQSNQNANRINILAHSMGNRFFEEIIKPHIPAEKKLIDNYISIGADLETNIFEKDQPLEHITSICKNILIYNHNNDRTLGISRALNDNERLGISGVSKDVLSDSAFQQIDVSLISDLQLITDISNHRYYYTSDQVKLDIKEYLLGEHCSQREAIAEGQHYKLCPPKSD